MCEKVIVVVLSVCLSVCHALILEITDNFELTQDDNLKLSIVLLCSTDGSHL